MIARNTGIWLKIRVAGFCLILFHVVSLISPTGAPCSEPRELLLVGRAHFMAGNLSEAVPLLEEVSSSGADGAVDAHYLLGRIHLLMGDYRQSKEYFERAFEACGQGDGRTTWCWRAAMGIGDALFGSGHYEEAIRRYRLADPGSGERRPELDLKIALSEMALGREEESLERMHTSLARIPVLSGWVGRERDFMRTLFMQGLNRGPSGNESRHYVFVGPVGRKVTSLEGIEIDTAVPVKRVKRAGRYYLELGPFLDSIEAVMMAETIKTNTAFGAEVEER